MVTPSASVLLMVLAATSGDRHRPTPTSASSAPSLRRIEELKRTIALKRKRRRTSGLNALTAPMIDLAASIAAAGGTPTVCPDCGSISAGSGGGTGTGTGNAPLTMQAIHTGVRDGRPVTIQVSVGMSC